MNRVHDFRVGQPVVRVHDDARPQGDCIVVELREDLDCVLVEFDPEDGGDPIRVHCAPEELRIRVGGDQA